MDTRDKGRRRPPFPPLNRQCDLLKGQCRGPFRVSGAVLTLFAPVSALLRAFVALLGRWWHPCTPPTLETQCRPPVGRCFGSEGRGRRGQCRGSIFVLDKGRWSLCALLPGNTAPQRGSGIRRRRSVSGLFAVAGGRNNEIQATNRLHSHFPQVAVAGGHGSFGG